MAIYHLSVKYISRNQGRSAVGAAAYRSGEKLHNEYDGLIHDFTHKEGIDHTEILLPESAPREYNDRQTLWNAVEQSERRADSRTAREIELALPNELSLEEQKKLVRDYVNDNFISQGMCADIAIHDGHKHRKDQQHIEAENDKIINSNNPHAHILLTTRPVGKDGFSNKKNREWDKRENVDFWRENWAKAQNKEFERKGLEVRVDHRSNKDRGIQTEPTIHEGVAVRQMEKKGIRTDKGDLNRQIRQRNKSEVKTKVDIPKYLQKEQEKAKERWDKTWGENIDQSNIIEAEIRNPLGQVTATYHNLQKQNELREYLPQKESPVVSQNAPQTKDNMQTVLYDTTRPQDMKQEPIRPAQIKEPPKPEIKPQPEKKPFLYDTTKLNNLMDKNKKPEIKKEPEQKSFSYDTTKLNDFMGKNSRQRTPELRPEKEKSLEHER